MTLAYLISGLVLMEYQASSLLSSYFFHLQTFLKVLIELLSLKLTITQKQSQEQLAKISLLENQLAEKSADLELRNSKLRTLSREVVGLEDQYRKQREKEDSLNHCYHQISSFTLIFKEKFGKEFDKLEEGIALFRSLEGRISFAYNRLSTIQG